jgi:teichuronic acid biosynthesis glycosyltransferase TuaC
MRILFVTNYYPTSETPGASPCIEQQKRALEHLGVAVDVLYCDGPKSRLNYLKAMWRVLWVAQIRNQYNLIHAHYGFSGIVARAQFRCPVVVTFRGSDVLSSRERPISRLVGASVDKVIVMTEEMKSLLGRKDARVIPYGIDLQLFKPRSQAGAREELGLASEAPLVLFPYNPERREKRFDLVKQAVEFLKVEFPDIQVLAIYDKPYTSVATYMNASDVMILTSDSEGAPVAIREAMACNLPIVSVDVGDVVDVIRDTEGCFICAKTPGDIAAKLAQALKARNRTNGRLAASRFDLYQAAFKVVTIYQELLGEASNESMSNVFGNQPNCLADHQGVPSLTHRQSQSRPGVTNSKRHDN